MAGLNASPGAAVPTIAKCDPVLVSSVLLKEDITVAPLPLTETELISLMDRYPPMCRFST